MDRYIQHQRRQRAQRIHKHTAQRGETAVAEVVRTSVLPCRRERLPGLHACCALLISRVLAVVWFLLLETSTSEQTLHLVGYSTVPATAAAAVRVLVYARDVLVQRRKFFSGCSGQGTVHRCSEAKDD